MVKPVMSVSAPPAEVRTETLERRVSCAERSAAMAQASVGRGEPGKRHGGCCFAAEADGGRSKNPAVIIARFLAATRMTRESPGQTLPATALVHEAWLRLGGEAQPPWKKPGTFFRGGGDVAHPGRQCPPLARPNPTAAAATKETERP